MSVRYRTWLIWLGSLIIGFGFGSFGASPPTELWFLDVGQGDCAVFRHAGLTVLIDVGPATPDRDLAARRILMDLRAMGVNRIDLVLLSHPDADHIGGLRGLVGSIELGRVAAMEHFRHNADLEQWLESAHIAERDMMWLERGTGLRLGEFQARLDSVVYAMGDPDNHGSMFVRLFGNGAAATFSGDADSVAEMSVLGQFDWSAQVLKVGHHGSKNSTCEAWLQAVAPKWAVISCGRDNSYGHPAQDAVKRITDFGASVVRTDLEGDIRFELRQGQFVRAK